MRPELVRCGGGGELSVSLAHLVASPRVPLRRHRAPTSLRSYHAAMGGQKEQNDLKLDADRLQASIGIAISGGGLRAAFFSLGALLYLVHSGLHRNVRLISSVSGGSIVNMVVAMAGDFSESEPAAFGRLVGRVSKRMAKRGVFFWPGLTRTSLIVFLFVLWPGLWPALTIAGLSIMGAIDGWNWEIFWFNELWYSGVMTILYLAYILFGRQHIQQSSYRKFLAQAFPRGDSQQRTRRRQKLSLLPPSNVAHVLCATELTSGQPFYMSRHMVLSPVYGRGGPDISLSRAVYASAAFPIGFPPLRLRSRKLNLTGGQDDEPPKQLFLSDGGVFNNLGTETFSADSSAHIFLPDPSLPIIPPVDRQLVVNASSPPKKAALSRVPIWRTIACSARIMSVMYENTLRPRMQRLTEDQMKQDGPIIIDISDSPIELAVRLSNGRSETDQIRTRAMGMRDVLNQDRSDNEWKTYAERAARTKTVLSPVGRTAAIRLVRLGYLDTAIACHAHLGTQGINSVPNDKWFSDLVDNRLSDDQLVAPVSGYQAVEA